MDVNLLTAGNHKSYGYIKVTFQLLIVFKLILLTKNQFFLAYCSEKTKYDFRYFSNFICF
jgi:hypothetical protein